MFDTCAGAHHKSSLGSTLASMQGVAWPLTHIHRPQRLPPGSQASGCSEVQLLAAAPRLLQSFPEPGKGREARLGRLGPEMLRQNPFWSEKPCLMHVCAYMSVPTHACVRVHVCAQEYVHLCIVHVYVCI